MPAEVVGCAVTPRSAVGLLGGAAEERFELGGLLGRGGQATVYRARDRLLGREVALKIFDLDSDLASTDRVQHEMRTLAGLEHPRIVTVYDVGTADGRPYLVMRLVDRGSLAGLLADGPLPPSQAAGLIVALCDALAYVHARGLTHRDLKPANILLASDPAGGGLVPLLADFGMSSSVPGWGGSVTGTPAYLAPEQVEGLPSGPAVDVYALGLVVLEAVTGRREFGGPAHEAAVARLDRDPAIPAELPENLAGLLTAMTTRDPRRRPTAARAGETARTLAAGDDDTTLVRPPRPEPVASARRWPTSHLALLAGATVLGIVGVGVGVGLHGDPSSPPPAPVAPAPSVLVPAPAPPPTIAPAPAPPDHPHPHRRGGRHRR